MSPVGPAREGGNIPDVFGLTLVSIETKGCVCVGGNGPGCGTNPAFPRLRGGELGAQSVSRLGDRCL